MQNKSFKKRIIHYDYKLVKLARKLRNNSTFSEVLLWNVMWNVIKNKQLRGKFFFGNHLNSDYNKFCCVMLLSEYIFLD